MSKRIAFAPLAAIGLGFSLLAGSLVAPASAHAEGEIRIAEQFGIVYLLLNVVRDQQLIEKYGKQEGIEIKVDWTQLSGGAAVNDALLSGSIDIAGAGVGPLLTVWDRTRGKQNVKAVASLGNFPYYLLSNNPNVKTIADFTEQDRIAVPAVGVSVQSRLLQYAAAKQWGDKDFNRLDKYTLAVPHPDATAALIAGGTELTGHFSNPPFQDQALQNPNVHVVLNSYDVLGPNSPTVLFATEKFRDENPKTYKAFVEALTEAAEFAQKDKGAAADTYLRVTKAKIDRATLLKIIDNPQIEFTVSPKNTYPLAEFLYRVGAIKNKPASWEDYFFQDAKPLQGELIVMNALLQGHAASNPTSTGTALLSVDNVSLEYRTPQRVVRATHQVSFEVDPADRFVLLGPSGCGKSTLLKAIGGFITPCEGEIRLQGQTVSAPGPDRIVVFQEFDQLPPWKTVKQNVMFALLASGTLKRREAEERALHYLDKVGLAAFADAYPHTLSGGMKARVAIARALAMQPKILLMDEPFAALDALTRRKMQEELLLLWEEVRFTLLFVTHSIEEALVVGNRILLLSPHPGRVRAEIHSHQYDLHSLGGVGFQHTARRIHRLLFDESQSPEIERELDFTDIRIAY